MGGQGLAGFVIDFQSPDDPAGVVDPLRGFRIPEVV
jgi:hypothetical protein